MDKRQAAFIDWLKNKLSAAQFEAIPDVLGITGYRFTTLLRGSNQFEKKEILELIDYVNQVGGEEILPEELILKIGIGADLFTLEDMNNLVAVRGYEVGIVSHAA